METEEAADLVDDVARGAIPFNAITGIEYQGNNIMRFLMVELEKGYGDGGWAGFRQWRTVGRTVMRGEHGTAGFTVGGGGTDDDGNPRRGRPAGFTVFHFDQTTELELRKDTDVQKVIPLPTPEAKADLSA